jgi:hypothetical protein
MTLEQSQKDFMEDCNKALLFCLKATKTPQEEIDRIFEWLREYQRRLLEEDQGD